MLVYEITGQSNYHKTQTKQMHLQKKCFSFPKTVGSNCCEPCPGFYL